MKKIVISVAVIAALVGGGLFAKQKIESDIVAEVKTLIVSAPEYADVSASDIKFDLLSKELVISGIEIVGTEKLDNIVYLVDKVVLTGFNTDSLSATSGDYPVVADEIYVENFSTTVPPALSLSYESYTVKGYKQNLALLQEALQKKLMDESAWERILMFKLDSSEIKNYRIEDKLAGTGSLLIESLAATSASGTSFDFSMKNTTIDAPMENLKITLAEMKMDDFPMPTAKIMAELFRFIQEYELNPNAEPNLVLEDIKYLFNQDIKFSGLVINLAQSELASMKEFGIKTQAEPIQVNYGVQDFKLSETATTLMGIPNITKDLLLKELLINGAVELKLNETLDVLDYTNKASIKDVADMSYGGTIKTPIPMDGLVTDQFAILGSTLNSANIKYEDKGLLPRLVNYAETKQGMNFEQMDMTVNGLVEMAKADAPQFASIIDTIAKMWVKPGTIEIKLTKPTTIMNLANGSIENVEANYTESSKTLKELVADLKATQAN